MLQDGVAYPAIIRSLGEDGKHLNTVNISRWKNGGHKEWLIQQDFIERIRVRQETPGELVRDFDATEINHAALQLGSLHIFEALRDLGPGTLNEKLGGDCAAFARLLNALARTSRETMLLQKYREACARAREALMEIKDPKRKLNESETRAIVRTVDKILGLDFEDAEADASGGTQSGVAGQELGVASDQFSVNSHQPSDSEISGDELPRTVNQSLDAKVTDNESLVVSNQPPKTAADCNVEFPKDPGAAYG
jgi:hypothetical protein